MNNPLRNNKGVALLIVMGTFLVVVVLANVILALISSQSRLTHHQVSRIRAFYAAKAGIVLAFEKLRLKQWSQNPTLDTYYCINGRVNPATVCTQTIIDNDILPMNVEIRITPASLNSGNPGNTARITATTDYTYTP